MPSSNSFTKPSMVLRALFLAGVPAVLLPGAAGAPFAQSSPRAHLPPPSHPRSSRGVVHGPPSPVIMRDSIGLGGDKLKEYSRRYDGYMASTKPARDSLGATLKAMRSSFQSGDRTAAREHREDLRRRADQLKQKDQEFEKSIKQLLTSDQQKRYDQLKEHQDHGRSFSHQRREDRDRDRDPAR